jgi:hypothetical protein
MLFRSPDRLIRAVAVGIRQKFIVSLTRMCKECDTKYDNSLDFVSGEPKPPADLISVLPARAGA